MAEWLVKIQYSSGGFMSGKYEDNNKPAVIFNTGQILLGLVRAYKETHDKKFLESAKKAAGFLIDSQDKDGAWRKNIYSENKRTKTHAYNVRTAWAILKLYQITKDKKQLDHAKKNLDWTLKQQIENGFFTNNSMGKEAPLTHTIGYTIRGLIESGLILKEDRYIEAVKKTANRLIELQEKDGSLKGQFDERWEKAANYSCITGNAQIAIVWLKLYQSTKDMRYLKAAKKINDYNKKIQNINAKNKGIKGAMPGSYPTYGNYMQFHYPNWAAKFFIDSLILEEKLTRNRI